MGWILLFVVAVFVYLFISTKREEVTKVKSQGGLYLKYQELIDYFLTIPNIKVEKKNSYSIILAVKDPTVITRFTIGHGFEDVSVFWFHQSVMFGTHSLKWNFPESLPQSQMIDTIEQELELYNRNLIGNGF